MIKFYIGALFKFTICIVSWFHMRDHPTVFNILATIKLS